MLTPTPTAQFGAADAGPEVEAAISVEPTPTLRSAATAMKTEEDRRQSCDIVCISVQFGAHSFWFPPPQLQGLVPAKRSPSTRRDTWPRAADVASPRLVDLAPVG